MARSSLRVYFCLEWQTEERLREWLAAADCVLFNYSNILTSGAACEARSYGIPVLLPHRLAAINLMEPHSSVFRFDGIETDFRSKLSEALTAGRDYDGARDWRESTSWKKAAQITSKIYRVATQSERPRDMR
jgi:hypothetical protein